MKKILLAFLVLASSLLSLDGAIPALQDRNVTAQIDFSKKLQEQVVGEIKFATPEKWKELAAHPDFIKTLTRWKLHTSVSPQVMADLGKQRDPLIRTFMENEEWQYDFLNSGPIPNADQAIRNLSELLKKDPKIATDPMYRRIGTTTALEFARHINPEKPDERKDWTSENMLERYAYFRTSYDQKLLNGQFNELDYWDMRILTGCGAGAWGSRKSLTWQRDNVRLPAQNYTGACWQASWKRDNAWGESIHGKDYYVPFKDTFSCQAELVRNIGGVCGALSTYGAHAAIANGVPALTMGEPGHCAYTVRVSKNEWKPAYSLSWKRSPHWNFYGNKWSDLILMQENFSDKEAYNVSSRYLWMAQAAAVSGEKEHARSLFLESIKAQPRNFSHWTTYLDWEKEQGDFTAREWGHISAQLCNAFGKEYPEVCWNLLSQRIYPVIFPQLTNKEARLQELAKFHASLEKMAPAQWDYPGALEKQRELLGSDFGETKEFIKQIVAAHLASEAYGAPTLSWGFEKMSGNKETQKEFFTFVSNNSASGESDDKAMEALATTIILQAEQNEDIDNFQAAGNLVKDHFKPRLPDFEPFPGELLSSGGLLKLSTTSKRYGKPWEHWGVLEPCGGHFHTDDDNPATATVLLKKVSDIQGIIIISTNGNRGRGNNTTIAISEDGQNWTDVGKIEKMERVNRIDLKDKNRKGKYVRLTREGKSPYHLEGILIYGTFAS